MENTRLGFAMCGSFCTFDKALKQLRLLKELGYDLYPILSEYAYATDTRFGRAKDFQNEIEEICTRRIIHTIYEAEPIGPGKLLDLVVVAPCTGNTLAKMANSITDTSVTMAVKAHLRNDRPVLIAVSSNDSLSSSARNLGALMSRKNFFFVPMGQDDSEGKPTSMVANFDLLPDAVSMALRRKQLQPVIMQYGCTC